MSVREPKTWMWGEAVELIERAERLHRQFFQRLTSTRGPTWAPPVDIYETGESFSIVIALPGVPPDRIEVHLDMNVLIVAGTRPLPVECRAATINRLEIPHGRFERRIELPPGRFEFQHQESVYGCVVLILKKV